jgi:hypothetical protein
MLVLETCNMHKNVNVGVPGTFRPLELKKGSLNSKSIYTNTQCVNPALELLDEVHQWVQW